MEDSKVVNCVITYIIYYVILVIEDGKVTLWS